MQFSIDTIIDFLVPHIKTGKNEIVTTSELFSVKNPKGLFVLIPPWRSRVDCYALVRRKILKIGYDCLEYKFSPAIFSSDYIKTKTDFDTIKNIVRKDLEKLHKEKNFKEINIVGTSIGCVETLMIANHNPLIGDITLVAPGSSLAESMWEGIRTQNLRKEMQQKGMTLEFLKDQWRTLAPENNIDGLIGKKIYVYLSKSDKLIPYHLGKRLVESLKKSGNVVTIKENSWLGHYGTILSFCLRSPIIA